MCVRLEEKSTRKSNAEIIVLMVRESCTKKLTPKACLDLFKLN